VNKKQKEDKVNILKSKLKEASFVILTDFTGLSVEDMDYLRGSLKNMHTEYNVVKNSLIKLAVKNTEFQILESFFTGPNAIAFSKDDPIKISKVIFEFSKNNEKLKIKAGTLNGKILNSKDIKTLAALPDKEIIYAKLLGILKGIQSNLVMVLNGVPRKFLLTLEGIKKQKDESKN
jgi:large subunit ribosomal protein L10